jgi:hypothetical protein
LIFDENVNFFVENCQKSQKIVTITSTPAFKASRHLEALWAGLA